MLDQRLKEKLDERYARYKDLEEKFQDPTAASNPQYPDWLREHGTLGKSMKLYEEYLGLVRQIGDNTDLAEDANQDSELRDLAREEIETLQPRAEELEHEFIEMLLGGGEDNNKNVIMEIRAGTGGDEAALFAGDLYRMYDYYAQDRGWKVEIVSASPGEQGGFKEIILGVQGENAYRDLKLEGGGHRVQRVPATESQGRIHTSAATVAVLPEAEEYDVELKDEDLKIDIQASSGPGGQSVNTTNSSVRITHLPTGVVVFMQEEKSQHKNKAKALRVLRSRVYEIKKREEDEKRAAERRGQTGSGDRSERVRTYNFPQDRCTDHRLGRNFSLSDVIEGKLDKLVEELVEYGRQQELADA